MFLEHSLPSSWKLVIILGYCHKFHTLSFLLFLQYIAESYADTKDGEIWLINANIPEYLQANRFNHEPKRPRKLLLHRKQINKLMGSVDREGMTLIPLKLYFNERGRAKLLLAVAKGKKLHDKRESEKKRDWGREKGRLLRARG